VDELLREVPMGKRRSDNLRAPSEIKQASERHYNMYIRDAKKQPKENRVPSRKQSNNSTDISGFILRDPSAGDARACSQCECTNDKGYCDNYHLYAVMRGMCRIPVREDK
jgi:hypothetical protein